LRKQQTKTIQLQKGTPSFFIFSYHQRYIIIQNHKSDKHPTRSITLLYCHYQRKWPRWIYLQPTNNRKNQMQNRW